VTILISIFSFIVGILIASFVYVSPWFSVFLVLISIAILIGEKIQKGKVSKEVSIFALSLIFLSLGVLRYDIKDFHISQNPEMTGVVVSEPELEDNFTRFVFRTDNGEKILVSTDLYSPVQYGDRVILEGRLKVPGVIEGDDGRSFDYAKYLSKDDIYYTMSFVQVEVISSGHVHPIKSALLSIKHSFINKIRTILAEPESSLLSSLIVSGKDSLPEAILEEFRRAGIVHIVVLSGYNITIIAESLRRLFSGIFISLKLRRSSLYAGLVSILGILFFIIMTGGEATVVRASIMVLTVLLGKIIHRTYSAPRALLAAAFIMVLLNPKILTLDASFQLSFLATLALIYVVPIVEKWFMFIRDKFGLRTVIVTTIATQITVLPLLIYKMGDVSLVSLPTNILVLIFIPITMLFGFIAATLAYISTIIALPFAYISHLLLSWILFVSQFFGNLSFASIRVPPFSVWLTIFIYIALIFIVWRLRNSSPHSASSSSQRNLPRTASYH
jgi:competence protein ComEC